MKLFAVEGLSLIQCEEKEQIIAKVSQSFLCILFLAVHGKLSRKITCMEKLAKRVHR